MIRKQTGINQQELAKGILSVSHLSNLEANRYNASTEIIELLAKKSHVSPSYFINYAKEEPLLKERLIYLKREILLSPAKAYQSINQFQLPIENLELEISYHLLKATYYYKSNQLDKAKEIERNFLVYYNHFLENSLEQLSGLLKKCTLYYFGIRKYRENHLFESNKYFNQMLDLTNDNNIKANLLYNIALINYNQSNQLKAFESANNALQLFIELQEWEKIGELYNFLGVIYREASLLENALLLFQKVLNISKQLDLTNIEERVLHNIGLVFEDMGDYEKAIENFRLAYNLKRSSKKNIFITVRCLIRCHIKTNNVSQAKKLTRESLTIIEDQKQYHILKTLEAEIHYIENDYEIFLEKMTQSINYLCKHHYYKEAVGLSSKVAEFYLSQKKYKAAALNFKKELEIKDKLERG